MLTASEVRLLLAARKIFETGESVKVPCCSDPFPSHDISFYTALDHCEKYFHGSSAAYRVAKERIERKLSAANGRGFWGRTFLRQNGFRDWVQEKDENGDNWIRPGNVTEENFKNWCVLASMAYIDRIIDTGEVK